MKNGGTRLRYDGPMERNNSREGPNEEVMRRQAEERRTLRDVGLKRSSSSTLTRISGCVGRKRSKAPLNDEGTTVHRWPYLN